ncbi:MAG: hypothetical protein AAFY72_06575 [Cyanobacteria bacterium J06649_4]
MCAVTSAIAPLLLQGCIPTSLLGNLSTSNTPPLEDIPTASFDIQTIPIELPGETTGKGGIIAADITGDEQRELLVTHPQFIAAYDLSNGQLWKRTSDIWLSQQSESKVLPGRHGPGIQAGYVDQDGKQEVFYIIEGNVLEILSGETGELKYLVQLPSVEASFDQWEHGILANFSGDGDQQILLQASRRTDRENYVRDSVQAAFNLKDLIESGAEATPLWINEDFISLSHGPAVAVDINEDGKDEVVGVTILSAEGEILFSADIENTSFPHIDSIGIEDIVPERPGLELVIPEESGRKRVILFDEMGEIWRDRHRERTRDADGDKVAVGDFDPNEPGLEMWFRGSESEHLTVMSAAGDVIASYAFSNRQPEDWTNKGLEVIYRIQWSGAPTTYIAAKERHEAGDVGIFNAMTGQLIIRIPAATERLYVADLLGDWREELIVLEKEQIQIITNTAPNPNPDQISLWENPLYRRQKMTWNYYSL